MESYYHDRLDDKAIHETSHESGLSKSNYANHYPPTSYPAYPYTLGGASLDLAPISSAGLESVTLYPNSIIQPVTTQSIGFHEQYPPHTQDFNPTQWVPVDDHHDASHQYGNPYPAIGVSAAGHYVLAPLYTGTLEPSQALSPYEDHTKELQAVTLAHTSDYTQAYTTSALNLPIIPATTSHLQHDISYPAFTDPYPHTQTPVQEELISLLPNNAIHSTVKSRKRLDHEVLKRPTGSIGKQKRPAIVKGDRGKQSRAESCWRCRRYKKPCNKATGDCSSCITSGFRIWPSTLGCRRGQMTDFALLIIPSNVEVLTQPNSDYLKPLSWRKISDVFDNRFGEQNLTKLDKWDQLMIKIKAIRILGPGIIELLQIAANCERRREKQNVLLTLTARCLSITIDLWQSFVASTPGEYFHHQLNVKEIFQNLRQLLMSCVQRFLTSCLTGRLKDWFGTFMAVNILGLVYILLGDTILAIPDKAEVWPDIRKTIMDLRTFHPVCRDLLYVLAKGCDLLNMNWVENEEALRLMDDDEVICEAMRDLQLWRNNLMNFLSDDGWMEVAPFEVDLLPVTSLSRLFLQIQRKDDRSRIEAA